MMVWEGRKDIKIMTLEVMEVLAQQMQLMEMEVECMGVEEDIKGMLKMVEAMQVEETMEVEEVMGIVEAMAVEGATGEVMVVQAVMEVVVVFIVQSKGIAMVQINLAPTAQIIQ